MMRTWIAGTLTLGLLAGCGGDGGASGDAPAGGGPEAAAVEARGGEGQGTETGAGAGSTGTGGPGVGGESSLGDLFGQLMGGEGGIGTGELEEALRQQMEAFREAMEDLPLDEETRSRLERGEELSMEELAAALSGAAMRPNAGPVPGISDSTWLEPRSVVRNGAEADLVVRLGDIDNFGFGWPVGFDPFSGRSTPRHGFPWVPGENDPPGTDRIMVVSGHRVARGDGYTNSTRRPDNAPRPLVVEFDAAGLQIRSAALQLFLDDFQAPSFGTRYQVTLDGRPAPDVAAVVNELRQTGPIGKLVTVQVLPEYLPLLEDGRLEILFDDPLNDVADGFAIDFVRLLVNPREWSSAGTVRGVALDARSREPLTGVLVSAGNVSQGITGSDGRFELEGVPAGLVVVRGSLPGYTGAGESVDLVADEAVDVTLELEPVEATSEGLGEQLDREGSVDLYGIYFDLDEATLRSDSEPTLRQILGLLNDRPGLSIVIAGHTDSQGSEGHNQDLSERRAASVVAWLTERGIAAGRLQAEGHGESRPVADNATEEGRALNRRVEVRDASR